MEGQIQKSIFPIKDQAISEISSKGLAILKEADELQILDQLRLEYASLLLSDIVKIKRGAEERRQFFVKPLNDHVKAINDFFKNLLAPVEKADQIIRSKILNYRQREMKRIEEVEKERRQLLLENPIQGNPGSLPAERLEVQPLPKTVKVEGATTTTARKVWDFEILDASQVPREYLTIDAQAIRTAIKSGLRSIPGIRIFEREILSVRGLEKRF